MKLNMKMKQITKGITKKFFRGMFRSDNQITYVEARDKMKNEPYAILLDVRSKQEYDEYHLEGAVCIPTYELANAISKIAMSKEQTIIAYCQSGARSKKAVNLLEKMGYSKVYELAGGIDNL